MTNRRGMLSGLLAALCAPFARKADASALIGRCESNIAKALEADRRLLGDTCSLIVTEDLRNSGLRWNYLPIDTYVEVDLFTGTDKKTRYSFSGTDARFAIVRIHPRSGVTDDLKAQRNQMMANIKTGAWQVRQNLAHWCEECVRSYRGIPTHFPIEASEANIRRHAERLRELIHGDDVSPYTWGRFTGPAGDVKLQNGPWRVGVDKDELLRALAARGLNFT